MNVSAVQARWFRLCRSALVEALATPELVAATLAGVQAQILSAAGLALWNRVPGLTQRHVDALLHERRTLVKLWGQRGTLHLYPSAEWPLIHGALAGRATWWERQFAYNGGDVADYRAMIERISELLRERGTLGRSHVRAYGLALDETHLSGWGGIFTDLVRRGEACHAGQSDGEGLFAHRAYWLPDLDWNPPPPDAANAELARRYLHAYGPATAQDFAYWRGTSGREVRRWLAALGDAVAEVQVEGRPMLLLRADLDLLHMPPPEREQWPLRLLGRFDPLLLGLKDKTWLVEPQHYTRVWRPAGHIEATVLEHGRIAATWRYDRTSSGLLVTVTPFAPLAEEALAAVATQAAGVAAFFGVPLADLRVRS